MKRWLLIGGGVVLISFASGALGVFTAAELILGDHTPPKLRIWDFVDRTGQPPLYVSKTATEDDFNGSTFYMLIPPGEEVSAAPLGVAIRQEGSGAAVATTFYAENEGQGGPVWGLNSIASTYNRRPAVGMEVNGVNFSDEFAIVRGIDIVNGGTAPTEFGLGVMTSNELPAGKPRYGIVLAGPEFGYAEHSPASRAGIVIDRIDSGEAIRIAAGDFISLDGSAGRIRLRYNPEENRIEFYNGERLAHAIPM